MRVEPEDVAPIVNLVAELEEESGGHDSKYGSLNTITWRLRTYPRDDYLRVKVKIDNWTFWNGEQVSKFKKRIRRFADEHGNINDRIFYLEQEKPVAVSLKIPLEESEGENQ